MARSAVIFLAAAASAVPLGGCGGGDGGDGAASGTTDTGQAAEPVILEFSEEHGSGQSGTATLTPIEGEIPTFEAVITLGPASDAALPAHIHNVTCAVYAAEITSAEEREASIASFLNDVRHGTSTTIVPRPLDERTTGEYSINVHDPPRNQETVACGDIPGR
jgi:hypothetical protein